MPDIVMTISAAGAALLRVTAGYSTASGALARFSRVSAPSGTCILLVVTVYRLAPKGFDVQGDGWAGEEGSSVPASDFIKISLLRKKIYRSCCRTGSIAGGTWRRRLGGESFAHLSHRWTMWCDFFFVRDVAGPS